MAYVSTLWMPSTLDANMSPYKIAGCCSCCDMLCFEVTAVREDGKPKTFGRPNDGATRITFLLLNGRRTDMTFCGACAGSLDPQWYATLWRKNLSGWLREQGGNTEKFKHEFANGILCEIGRITWKELVSHVR